MVFIFILLVKIRGLYSPDSVGLDLLDLVLEPWFSFSSPWRIFVSSNLVLASTYSCNKFAVSL